MLRETTDDSGDAVPLPLVNDDDAAAPRAAPGDCVPAGPGVPPPPPPPKGLWGSVAAGRGALRPPPGVAATDDEREGGDACRDGAAAAPAVEADVAMAGDALRGGRGACVRRGRGGVSTADAVR